MNYKHAAICLALVLLASCSPKNGLMVIKDKDGSKMIVGISDRNALMNDKAFGWFRQGYDTYKPNAAAVSALSRIAPSVHIEVFGGTWCSDTHDLLPGFYKAMDAAGIHDTQVTLHLVDREKRTRDGSAEKYHITNVPTFVIAVNGKQIGKIVESAKTTVEGDMAAMLIDKD